ncbi:MAG: FAD-dependent oxidoreductase [Burkholderiales bacterium]|nr:FAD-dependent oxidoreductase [Burkholderiales bacterium]
MQADVVVVGGGGAGLAAAIGARQAGADVVLLEKNPILGGTTARSVGSISATGTAHQRRHGIADTPEEHYRDMPLFADGKHPDNDELRRVLTDNVPETFRWLGAAGVEFFGPSEEPPHTKPRMHNVLPNSRAYIFHLENTARRLGVRILTQARARRLVTSGGRVSGVELDRGAAAGAVVEAGRGVILAAGDYAANVEMKRALIGEAVAITEPTNPTSTGDGIRMGLELGGSIINGERYSGGIRFVAPTKPSWLTGLPPSRWLMRPAGLALRRAPSALVRKFLMGFLTTVLVPSARLFSDGAILVNANGERFAEERQKMVAELAYQPSGVAYIVFDGALGERFMRWPNFISTAPGIAYAYLDDYERNRPDLFHRARSVEALARDLGMDPSHLSATLSAYNETAGTLAGASPRGDRPALAAPPYYALGPVKNFINFTDGGLAVNTRLQVLDQAGAPIAGLYAAGSNGQGGLLLDGHGHHLGWAFTSGRLAGAYAAANGA